MSSSWVEVENNTPETSCVYRQQMALKVETLLITIAGVMAVTTAMTSYRNMQAYTFQLLVVGQMGTDVINLCCISLTVVGLFNVAIGLFKALHRYSMSFNQYVSVVVVTLIANFAIGMVLTDYKTEVLQNLEPSMLKQLRELLATKERFGIGFSAAEAWDHMQLKMSCCGVNGYKDYIEFASSSNTQSDQLVPVSCCAMKPLSYKGTAERNLPVPANIAQCQLDAKLMVVNSVHLNTLGCQSPLSRWTLRMVNKMLAMVFCMICLQALGVFYLSWLGFRRSVAGQRSNLKA